VPFLILGPRLLRKFAKTLRGLRVMGGLTVVPGELRVITMRFRETSYLPLPWLLGRYTKKPGDEERAVAGRSAYALGRSYY